MNRAVSTILIPLLLVSQGLFSVPHSHAGTSVAEPDGHAARPHVHLFGADHHHGHHEDEESPSVPTEQVPDHDSDAVYTGGVQLLNDCKVAKVAKAGLLAVYMNCDESATVAVSRLCTRHHPPPILRPKFALYMQLLSIRC
ncbi:MAG TPA: hypothetical protein EYG03_25950 [Planctomycetes bacterium]|nr:hypothetical protein [Fuerstiella sp.]HIK95404.1 hypothetical protein [Planctomycetota bacterium]